MNVNVFWENDEALEANRRDHILKQLEIREIAKHVRDGMRVLDVGCGDGETGLHLLRQFEIGWTGCDRSHKMIDLASKALELASGRNELRGNWATRVSDVARPIVDYSYDLIYSERCIITLPDWPTQETAIRNIIALLRPGGKYVMFEHSEDGLQRLNEWRAKVGLAAITVPPWNRYLRDAEVTGLARALDDASGLAVNRWPEYFASTYYLLSRVVNAAMAQAEGREPEYDCLVNRLALSLPNMGDIGHAAKWVWRKYDDQH